MTDEEFIKELIESVVSDVELGKRRKHVDLREKYSLLDLINENLRARDRITFIHRIIYIGRHSFPGTSEGNEDLLSLFQKSISTVNEDYCAEALTGCFIYYAKHYIHVVEGSEDAIGNHVKYMIGEMDKNLDQFGKQKIVLLTHHIAKRLFDAWVSMYAVPRKLFGKISTARENQQRQLRTFLEKMYTIADYMSKENISSTDMSKMMTPQFIALLPERKLIRFLLRIQCLNNLRGYATVYDHFPHLKEYAEHCWPPPMDLIPYNVYHEIPEPKPLEVPEYEAEIEKEVQMREQQQLLKEKVEQEMEQKTRRSSGLMDFLKRKSVVELAQESVIGETSEGMERKSGTPVGKSSSQISSQGEITSQRESQGASQRASQSTSQRESRGSSQRASQSTSQRASQSTSLRESQRTSQVQSGSTTSRQSASGNLGGTEDT